MQASAEWHYENLAREPDSIAEPQKRGAGRRSSPQGRLCRRLRRCARAPLTGRSPPSLGSASGLSLAKRFAPAA